ncbi:hypothetical protein [Amycolatopsis oliviviridis]|uniref:hypothetical protein n=1 Tax=Amycolatopsis oliviviridis TaxID=1471590 RepID=UPI00174D25C0|nr:hypothetical protein [Amycolatopsis oliviviridis]
MKKTLGRLAGAVLAGAVISLAVTPAAMAQEETTTTPTPSSSETPTTAPSPSWTGGKVTSAPPEPSAPASSSSQEPTPTGTPTSGKPSPTSTSEKPTTTPNPEEPYVDNVGAGYIGDNGVGALVIACASGEPSNVSAPDFDTLYSNQAEDDGRYWVYIVKVKKSFKGNSSTFTWTCDGKSGKGDIEFESPIGGGAATPGKPEKQVKYAPKGGIETGFGATAA